MSTFLGGSAFWIASLLVLVRLVVIGWQDRSAPRRCIALWLIILAAAAVLLFRPHEDVFGGQDQGAYLNCALTMARKQSLSYTDPLLSQVPVEDRDDFFYGYRYFPDTKYMCFWVSDVEKATISPWFQPAYPMLMSAVAKIAPDRWVLYVAPLFALFTAVALWSLAPKLLPHRWAGGAAFILYVTNPIVVWHARSARAEVVASFFLFAACTLILHAWRKREPHAWLDVLAASACAGLAPFFHITAWVATFTLSFVLVILMIRGRPLFLPFLAGMLAAALALVLQTRYVTDCYGLTPFLEIAWERPGLVTVISIAGAFILCAVSLVVRSTERPGTTPPDDAAGQWTAETGTWVIAAITTVLVLLAYFNVFSTAPEGDQSYLLSKIEVTEFRALVIGMSPALATLGLLGWITFLVRRGPTQVVRVIFALAAYPAVMLAGKMPILMYFLRRSLVVIIPIFVLCLCAFIGLIRLEGRRRRLRQIAVIVLVGMVCALGALKRGPLYTTTDYKGLIEFLRPFAKTVQREQGILLCEYSRIAAPMDHFFGLPVLGLDNERRYHYRPALDAWKRIMQNNPGRKVFYLTPFGTPIADGFEFKLVHSENFQMRFLRTEPRRLTLDIRTPKLSLSLYEMSLRLSGLTLRYPVTFPYTRTMDESNMGLQNVFGGRSRMWNIGGLAVGPETATLIPTPVGAEARRVDEILVFFMGPDADTPTPTIRFDGAAPVRSEWIRLVGNWWVLRAVPPGHKLPPSFSVTTPIPMLLSNVNTVTGDGTMAEPLEPDRFVWWQKLMYTRWMRSAADLLVPVPKERGLACVLINTCRPEANDRPRFSVFLDEKEPSCVRRLDPRWTWEVTVVRPGGPDQGVQWLKLITTPPWDPERRGIPRNLGVLLGGAAVIGPMETSEESE